MKPALKKINDKFFRLNNFYKIVGKNGRSIPFELNPIQKSLIKSLHRRNLILKARQLGMTTFSVLYMLDEALFYPNKQIGIVSYSLEHSQHIFKRIIGHAVDNLTPMAKTLFPIKSRSARELTFENGSFIRVDTSLRGGTYSDLLVSEFGKTCARNPLKAEEVVTGTLESASPNSLIIIESTGEGNSGFFADMVSAAAMRREKTLGDLDYKLFFFPWFEDKTYVSHQEIDSSTETTDYFLELEKKDIFLSKVQKNWYLLKKQTLGEKIKQEFPSCIEEAFLSSSEGYYFQKHIEEAYKENRIASVDIYDPLEPVYVSMDIGIADETVIVFFQLVHREIRIIDTHNANSLGAIDYANFLLKEKNITIIPYFCPTMRKREMGLWLKIRTKGSFERFFRIPLQKLLY